VTLPLFDAPALMQGQLSKKLRPYQSRAIIEVRAKVLMGVLRVLCVSPTGCHARGQRVMMFDGSFRTIEDVRAGDTLMGPDSRPRKVLVLRRGRGLMYRIVPIKGESWIVNEDHVLTLVRTNADKQPHRDGELVDVTVREWLTWPKWRKHIHKLLRVGVVFSTRSVLPVDPYILGVFLGDGCGTISTPHIAIPEPEIQQSVIDYAAAAGMRVRRDIGRGDSNPVLHLLGRDPGRYTRNRFQEKLRLLGLFGKTSEDKFVPRMYLTASRDERLAALAGLIDTDGSLSGNSYDFVSKSRQLAEDIAFLARSVGLAAYPRECKKSCQTGAIGTYWRVCISGNTSIVPCRVARKRASPRGQKKDALRTGFSVDPAGEDEFYGFTLDGDGRYLLDDFTVTHNSGKMFVLANIIRSATLPVLFVAHRKEILDQCVSQLAGQWITNVGVIRGADARYNPSASVQVGSIATLARRDKPFLGQKIIIIIDEAHRAASDVYVELLSHYPDAIVIGFTATPVRLDGRPLGGDLFQELVQIATYAELLKNPDWLVAPDVFAGSAPDVSGVRKSGYDFDEKQLGDVARTSKLEGDVVEHWLRRAHLHPVFTEQGMRIPNRLVEGERRRTVLFAVNIDHSLSLAGRFEKAGVRVAHLDGDTPEHLREAMLRDLASGQLEMVTNCLVAVEGLDVPEVKCVVSARPTHSVTLWRQQVGREMRPWRGVVPLLLDHAGNFDRLGCPFEDVVWSLKEKPRRAKGQEPMRKCPTCGGYVPLSKTMCPHCNAELPRAESESLAENDGELRERQTEPEALRWAFFWRQVIMAKSKGFKPGFASAIYKEHYGQWPPRHWSEKIKADFATDVLWQDLLARRLARKAAREERAKREEQALSEANESDARELSEEESAIAQTIGAFDAPDVPDPNFDDPPFDDAGGVDSPFADWLRDEGIG
jgi:superfamily II DNA or RNA helicase